MRTEPLDSAPIPRSSFVLRARGIGKSFPGVRALHQVDLEASAGEVVAVLGENGAGKSTLMKILAGVQAPDEGVLEVGETAVAFESTRDAMAHGISLIHQELDLADNLTVAENIWLGREPRRFGFVERGRMVRASRSLLERIGADFGPADVVETLSIGRQQLVEIAKALSVDARVLIMDEPTSSLSQRESERLFDVVRELRRAGVCILYISHRLGEVIELADRVVVLRDGENAGDLSGDGITRDAMVRLMVGRDLSSHYERREVQKHGVALRVRDLRVPGSAFSCDFDVQRGEVVGLAGLVGAGRTELLETLFGVRRALGGDVRVDDQRVPEASPRGAIEAGMVLVPEDRKQQGLFLEASILENIGVAALHRNQRAGWLDTGAATLVAHSMIDRLRIKTPSALQLAGLLSGGNQQKVVLAKWLSLEPQVLLLDEPTRGIDVGARHELYEHIERLADQGLAILFVSSEMEEILSLSDRVLVMHEGRIAGVLDEHELSEESVMHLATGGA